MHRNHTRAVFYASLYCTWLEQCSNGGGGGDGIRSSTRGSSSHKVRASMLTLMDLFNCQPVVLREARFTRIATTNENLFIIACMYACVCVRQL
jgi:hypothetical protein